MWRDEFFSFSPVHTRCLKNKSGYDCPLKIVLSVTQARWKRHWEKKVVWLDRFKSRLPVITPVVRVHYNQIQASYLKQALSLWSDFRWMTPPSPGRLYRPFSPLAWSSNLPFLWAPVPSLARWAGIPSLQAQHAHLKAIPGLRVGAAGFQWDPLTRKVEGGKVLGKSGNGY